jgi:lipopolysaccharide/colanic/teichoic acid biosynthesis glycosyltransferase
MAERVERLLSERLDAAQMQNVRVACYIFPEDDGKSAGTTTQLFYIDSKKKDIPGRLTPVIKRAIDVAGSLAALAVLSPFFLVISIMIKRVSAGPVY